MGKGKKNKKHQKVYQAIKPIIKDDRILLSLVGAVGLGVTLASVMGLEEGGAFVAKVKDAVHNLEEVIGLRSPSKKNNKKVNKAS